MDRMTPRTAKELSGNPGQLTAAEFARDAAHKVSMDLAQEIHVQAKLEPLFYQAMTQARDEALEMAALECEKVEDDWRDGEEYEKGYAAEYLAIRIRALKSKTEKG